MIDEHSAKTLTCLRDQRESNRSVLRGLLILVSVSSGLFEYLDVVLSHQDIQTSGSASTLLCLKVGFATPCNESYGPSDIGIIFGFTSVLKRRIDLTPYSM